MTWLAWRQLRTPAVVVVVGAAVLVALLVLTGPGLAEQFRTSGLASCADGRVPEGATLSCGDLERELLGRQPQLSSIGGLLLVLPVLLGAFWGAPLVARELEAGTHRFAWVQGVTRRRWLATRLGLAVGVGATTAGVLAATWTWWSRPADRLGSRLDPGAFAQRGLAPVAYVVFAIALGVLAGAVLRRTLPAMAVTVAGFAAARALVQSTVRPRLADTVTVRYPTFSFRADDPDGLQIVERGWPLSARTIDAAGDVVTTGGFLSPDGAANVCGLAPADLNKQLLDACGERLGLVNVARAVRADQFWTLQLWEAALFVSAAAALALAALWWVRRRLV